MRINILIKNGHVIDPANKVDEIKNVVISNGFIVEENSIQPDIILDAKGNIFSWIDRLSRTYSC